jgi:hypothetical protein
MRFLGLGLGDPVPDANTIWTFRDKTARRAAAHGPVAVPAREPGLRPDLAGVLRLRIGAGPVPISRPRQPARKVAFRQRLHGLCL